MKQSLTLSIPKPCAEKWQNFNPTAHGGFCSGCQKEVIDFTTWDEERIKVWFSTNTGSTCGRFKMDQLKMYSFEAAANRRAWLPLSFVGMSLLLGNHISQAQDIPKTKTETVQIEKVGKIKIGSQPSPVSSRTIEGIVRDSLDHAGLPGVNIPLKGTVHGTTTDAAGKFTFSLEHPQADDVLVFSFVGFETIEYTLASYTGSLEIKMIQSSTSSEVIMVGGVISVRRWSPRAIWWRIKRLFY